MADDLPSPETLDTLVQVALDERSLGFQALDALDTKAGILLAVDGLLIAAATQAGNVWMRGIAIAAFVIAAAPALWALRVSAYQQIHVKPLRDLYWLGPPADVRGQVLSTLIEHEAAFESARESKSSHVRVALILTVVAIAVLVASAFMPTT